MRERFRGHDLRALGAELAYRYFMALFPFIVVLGTLGALAAQLFGIENPARRLLDLGAETLPGEVIAVVRPTLERAISARDGALLSIGVIGALISATGATSATVKAMNRAYGVEETRLRGRRWWFSLGLTLGTGIALIGGFAVVVAGGASVSWVADRLGAGRGLGLAIAVGGWVLVGLLLLAVATLVYWIAPNVRRPIRRALPGALLFGAGWLVATVLLQLYVSYMGSHTIYGVLAGVWLVMVWFLAVGTLLVLGAELNAALDEGPSLERTARRAWQHADQLTDRPAA